MTRHECLGEPCRTCADRTAARAHATAVRVFRTRHDAEFRDLLAGLKRCAPATGPARCGDYAGALKHYRLREVLCAPCRSAAQAYQRDRAVKLKTREALAWEVLTARYADELRDLVDEAVRAEARTGRGDPPPGMTWDQVDAERAVAEAAVRLERSAQYNHNTVAAHAAFDEALQRRAEVLRAERLVAV